MSKDKQTSVISFANWHIAPDQIEVAATVVARLAALCNPEMDEAECFEIALDFISDSELNVVNVQDLVAMFKCTCFNPKYDQIQ